jgi:hypothetical protein
LKEALQIAPSLLTRPTLPIDEHLFDCTVEFAPSSRCAAASGIVYRAAFGRKPEGITNDILHVLSPPASCFVFQVVVHAAEDRVDERVQIRPSSFEAFSKKALS